MHSVSAKWLVVATVVFCSVFGSVLYAQSLPGAGQQSAITIDLNRALELARRNSPQLQSATIGVNLAAEDRLQSRAAMLPSLTYTNQYLYTQGNGTSSGIFVSNDGVHLYNSQAEVHQELFSPERLADYRRTIAAQALAVARKDVAERGLVATVVLNYYGLASAQRRIGNAQEAVKEALSFVDITTKLEAGGEVARADVLKAQIVLQERQRELQNTQLAIEKARMDLAVLLFPDFRLDFNVADDLGTLASLPAYAEIETLAKQKSPDLRMAQESIRQEEFNIKIAKAAYLPTLSLDYFFGINANRFAVHDEEGNRQLGSVAQATLTIPLWTWGATGSKARAAEMRRQQAQLDLELTRRQLIANLHALYAEAQAAQAQLDSLRRTVTDATESLRLTNLRYEAGEVSVLEVVDAQATLAQSRTSYEDGLLRYRQAFSGLQILIGTI